MKFPHTVPEGTPCETTKREPGICTDINKCDYMRDLLRTKSEDLETVSYIQSATCCFNNETRVLCCPHQVSSNVTHTGQGRFAKINETEDEVENGTLARLLSKPYCGLSNISNGRIVGGMPAVLDQFPFIVALGYRNPRNPSLPKWLCGGTLISDRHILTAAHCVHNRTDLYFARLGELDLYSSDEGAEPEDIKIANAKIHDKFNPIQHTYDIAILTLERKFTSARVWPICLPHEDSLRSDSFLGHSLIVAGWGALYFDGPTSSTLQLVELPVVNQDYCEQSFGNETVISDNIICAGYVDKTIKDNCQGDSGGPLMYSEREGKVLRYYQIGIVSYGFRCAETGYPGVYTRVTNFIDWVRKNME
ncbi:hypothetical protein JTB14_007564 [Gonioctena quinquepunctata]|nr:hypothetical protein JTB14_007564 [Gonioctena quinquepunctata]